MAKVADYISSKIKRGANSAVERIEERIIELEEKLLKNFLSMLMLSAGIIFIAVGVYFLLTDFLNLSNTSSFLIVGALLLIVSLTTKKMKGGK